MNISVMAWLHDYWLRLLAILLALGALATLPFVYYQLMNWVVMGAAILIARDAFKQHQEAIVWLFILLAVVFNPIAPLYLGQFAWKIADVIAALLLVASFFMVPARHTKIA